MKFCFKFVIVELLVFSIYVELSVSKIICPKICYCDVFNGLNRATCTDHKIIDADVGVPHNVQIYDLSQNQISQIEDYTFEKLNYELLEELDLSENFIFWIGLHGFDGLKSLKILNLASNRLEGLTHDIFLYNPKLFSLDISRNKFLNLKNAPLLSHKNLQILNVSFSQIKFLPDSIFNQLPNLKEIDLHGNYLTQINAPVLKPVNKLKIINLRENNIQCNAVFKDLQKWMEIRKITHDHNCEVKLDNIKKFEKMESMVPELDEEDIDELWLYSDEKIESYNHDENTVESNLDKTFLMLYNERVPSLISLLIGFQMGIVIGILGTYCWIRKLYSCGHIELSNRREMRRMRRNEVTENRLLISSSSLQDRFATPPITRRLFLNTSNSRRPLTSIRLVNRNLNCIQNPRNTNFAESNLSDPRNESTDDELLRWSRRVQNNFETPPMERRQLVPNTNIPTPISDIVNSNMISILTSSLHHANTNTTTGNSSGTQNTTTENHQPLRWSISMQNTSAVSPIVRGQLSRTAASRSTNDIVPNINTRDLTSTANLMNTNSSANSRSETPPPTYRDCLNDAVIIGND